MKPFAVRIHKQYLWHVVLFLVLFFLLAFGVGHEVAEYNQTCPILCEEVEAEAEAVSTDIFDVEKEVRDSYCEILAPVEVPVYIKSVCPACDCTEEAKVAWKSCVDSYESVTSQKFPKRTELKAKDYRH